MVDDIELTDWDATTYSGTIDGNGNSITYRNTSGLFTTTTDATLKNLTVNAIVEASGKIAGIATYAEGNTVFENVILNGTVISTEGDAGGFVAKANSAGATLTISACENNAEIIAHETKAAGFVVSTANMTETVFKDCKNTGDVTVIDDMASSSEVYGGAFVAWGQNVVKIDGCTNEGEITATRVKSGESTVAAGGFIGVAWYLKSDSTTDVTITNSANSGNVQSENQGSDHNAYAGGMVGLVNPRAFVTFENVTSNGAIAAKCTSESNTAGYSAAGGLVGNLNNSYSATAITVNSATIGENCVLAAESTSNNNYTGTVLGNRAAGNITITDVTVPAGTALSQIGNGA